MASEISRALGLEESYEFEGTTYKLAVCSFEVIAQWEAWLKRRADCDLLLSKRWLTEAEYFLRVDRLAAQKAAGEFDFFGPVSAAAMRGWEGNVEFAALRLSMAESNKLSLDDARKLARRVMETNVEKWSELQRTMREMDDDPNSRAPQSRGEVSASSPFAPASSTGSPTSTPGKSAG